MSVMNSIEELGLDATGLREVLAKYSDYRRAKTEELPFRDAANDDEKKVISKVRSKGIGLLLFGTVLLGALTAFSVVRKDGIVGIAILGLMFLLFLVFLIRNISIKATIMKATAVYKKFEYRTGDNPQAKSYYVTVIVDEPEKLLYPRIGISKADYEITEEGTEMYVVMNGGFLKAVPVHR